MEKVQQNLRRHYSSECKFIAILGAFFHLQCCATLETFPREFQPVPALGTTGNRSVNGLATAGTAATRVS